MPAMGLIQANNAILNQIGTDQNLLFVASAETVIQLFEDAVARAEAYDPEGTHGPGFAAPS